jgi:muramoyltetrapeptide carboxypeptidase
MKIPDNETGAMIDIIAPSGKVIDPATFQACEKIINSWGHQVFWGENILGNHSFLSNTVNHRFEDLKNAIYSSSKVIWGYRGGSGAAELLPLLSTLSPPEKQKIFLGFSDMTSLHIFFTQHWNWTTFHGPGAKQLLNESIDDASLNSVKKLLQQRLNLTQYNVYHELQLNDYNSAAKNTTESFSASITGGNLTVICHSLGTPYQMMTKNKILLLEDLNEPVYKIRRMLVHLTQAGIFENIKALILGEFIQQKINNVSETENELLEFSQTQSFPVYRTNRVGHGKQNWVVPFNTEVHLSKIY